MPHRKPNSARWGKLGLSAVLLTACLLLAVGTAWGRYRTDFRADLEFRPRVPSQVYLWGAKDTDGNYTQLPGTWALSATAAQGKELAFLVTNGKPQDGETQAAFAQEDLTLTLRLTATEGVGDAGNIKLFLRIGDEESAVYAAAAERIQEGTALYSQFGDGWIYRFFDTDGQELQWTLPGGVLSELSATLICTNVGLGTDPNMLQMQIIAAGNG